MLHASSSPTASSHPFHRGPYILIVKWDRFRAAAIQRCAETAFPDTDIVVCHTARDALACVRTQPAWLGLIGLSLPDIDGLDLLATVSHERLVSRLLVVSGRHDERTHNVLRTASINGYFDCGHCSPDDLIEAARRVGQGGGYFSMSLTGPCRETIPLNSLLTLSELQVFAVIGDGADDGQAADRLGLSVTTIHTYRQRIMRKLSVQTRADLMKEALRRGVVRLGHGRVFRPGFECDLLSRQPDETETYSFQSIA